MCSTTPLRNIKEHLAQYLTDAELRRVSDFELAAVTAQPNGDRTVRFDYVENDVLKSARISKNDLFLGAYHQLEWKVGKQGDWTNQKPIGVNSDAGGLYEAALITRGGAENMIDGLSTKVLESQSDHQASIEAGKGARFLINPFISSGDGEVSGEIALPAHFGTTYSVEVDGEVPAENQIYFRHSFKGIRLRNFSWKFSTENWSSVDEFLNLLESRS